MIFFAKYAERNPRALAIVLSSVSFVAVSLLPKSLVIAKDMMVAFYFGTVEALDIYLMAFLLVGMPVSIIVVALQTTLIPALVQKPIEISAGLLGGSVKLALVALLLILPLWLTVLPYILKVFYPIATNEMRSSLLEACFWMIPYYFLNGVNILFYGALQARKTFWVNALLPGVFPIATIVALGLFRQADIRALLIGTVMGGLVETITLCSLLLRNKAIRWRNTSHSGLRAVILSAVPLMFGAVASSLAPLIEQMIAFNIGPGSVSLLSYGNKVPSTMNTLLVTAIGIVVLPHFADMVADRQWRESRSLHVRLSGILITIGVIVATVLALFAEDIVALLFQRGAFTATDSQLVTEITQVYLFQLPFLMAAMLSSRALAAIGKTSTLTAIALMQLTLVSCLAYFFSRRYGVIGVPIGSLVSSILIMSVMGYAVWQVFTKKLRTQLP